MEKVTKENKPQKSVVSKKETNTNLESIKTTSSRKLSSTSKKSPTKANAKVTTQKKTTKKTSRRATSPKATTKETTSKKRTSTASKKKVATKKLENLPKMKMDILEYYDLPYRYNQTIVKLLFQTPKTLFVYWDITDQDRERYRNQYGESFFENTKPVLVIHNQSKNYTFEIEINDFANSWYFNVPDPDCKYVIELGRRPKNHEISIPNDYLYITSSNELDAPNDHVLFQPTDGKLLYKNAKTHKLSQKDFGSITFMRNLKNIYSISEFYHQIYDEEMLYEIEQHCIQNPTSGIM